MFSRYRSFLLWVFFVNMCTTELRFPVKTGQVSRFSIIQSDKRKKSANQSENTSSQSLFYVKTKKYKYRPRHILETTEPPARNDASVKPRWCDGACANLIPRASSILTAKSEIIPFFRFLPIRDNSRVFLWWFYRRLQI